MDRLNEIQLNILSLAKKFIQRQSIVLDAMRELRPDLVMRYYDKIGTPVQWAELKSKHAGIAQSGHWGKNSEWEYLLHGPGCRLTNIETSEVIEWDVGDLKKFNVDWFISYLQSLFKQEIDNDLLSIRSFLSTTKQVEEMTDDELADQHYEWKKQLEPVLEQLCELGFLSKGSSFTYSLVD